MRLPETRVLRRIGLPRARQQRFDLALQAPLLLLHPTVTHRLALAGIGSNLRPVDRQLAEVPNPGLARQTDHLHKQRLEIRQMTPAKLANRPMARKIPRRQHPKCHVLLQLPRQPSGRKHPRRVPVDQHLRHHPRLIRRLATTVPLVRRVKRRQVQSVHQIAHMVCQVPLRQPIPYIRRQQQPLLRLVRAKRRRHRILLLTATLLSHSLPTAQAPRSLSD